MELFKIFPGLLLDLITKVVPGSIFIVAFRNRYLPPYDQFLQLFDPASLSAELKSYGSVALFLVCAYLIGVFIAIASNALDGWLVEQVWQPRIKTSPADYFYVEEQPADFPAILSSSAGFTRFVEYCRTSVTSGSVALSFALEKYRTVYRLFFGFSILAVAMLFYQSGAYVLYALPFVPVSAWLTHQMQKRYLIKSIQLFSLQRLADKASKAEKGAKD